MVKRRRFTLMPAIMLAALSLMVTVPALSSMHLYAASRRHTLGDCFDAHRSQRRHSRHDRSHSRS